MKSKQEGEGRWGKRRQTMIEEEGVEGGMRGVDQHSAVGAVPPPRPEGGAGGEGGHTAVHEGVVEGERLGVHTNGCVVLTLQSIHTHQWMRCIDTASNTYTPMDALY